MKKLLVVALLVSLTATSLRAESEVESKPYQPNWESLSKHQAAPEWMEDAKLGIYFHWGPYSVPAFGSEWYPRNMHIKDHYVNKHHLKTYGEPTEFGYHDFVPEFKAENFDPNAWADLFQRAGARFAGPVAEHHDGYSMWASKVTPWNAKDTGPKRDILGELFQALEKRNMKTIATFHHARNLQRYRDSWEEELERVKLKEVAPPRAFFKSHYPYNPDSPQASEDSRLRLLYGNLPEQEWLDNVWLAKLKEVIDNYRPDAIWFDSWLDQIPETHRQRFSAYYLNAASQWEKDVAIIRKGNDLPISYTVNDHEKSREAKALPALWMTDDTISTGSWSYTNNLRIKPLYKVIHALVDTVSKNGVMLLNVSPKADGTIPEDQREVLTGLGTWLQANGEAIYETRPWVVAAEGPTAEPTGGFSDHREFLKLEYSAADIRYTSSKDGNTIYAVLLGVSKPGSSVTLRAFAGERNMVGSVNLLSGLPVKWEVKADGLHVTVPELSDDADVTTVLKITRY